LSHRSQDWNENLAKDLRDPEFAREFLLGLLEEGFSVQEALSKTIRAYGVNEFAKKARMASSNVCRAIRKNFNPSQQTLERLLKPLGLRLFAAPKKSRIAA
jgi:DNA-binding phage protein